ncbi:MAG: transposase, partial [Carnobacterium maltaromaticum]
KVNCKKLITRCDIPVSRFTLARHLKQQGLRYKKIRKSLSLNPLDKVKRCDLTKMWLAENHLWERTIFSDEKWFSLDGPDDWRTYVKKEQINYRPRHQKKGGGIMVWAMVLPNGLLSYKILNRDFKSPAYLDLLCRTVVPIGKLNYGNYFWFQQDNSRIHTARIVKEWMAAAHFPVLSWPARSPDLNIMENIWKVLEDVIYDRSPLTSQGDLIEEVRKAFLLINTTKRELIINLYKTFRNRLVKVLVNNDNEINI